MDISHYLYLCLVFSFEIFISHQPGILWIAYNATIKKNRKKVPYELYKLIETFVFLFIKYIHHSVTKKKIHS